jgi:hypothetical protein
MEHSMHLGAEKFVKGVAPTAGRSILKKVHDTSNIDQDYEDSPDRDSGDDEDEENDDFDVGDACGKALALVKQVGFVQLKTLFLS